jgi:hypothetical protein
LRALARLHFDAVHERANRYALQRQSIT